MFQSIKKWVVALTLVFILAVPAFGWEEITRKTYHGSTGEEVTITWDLADDTSIYQHLEILVWNVERTLKGIAVDMNVPIDAETYTFSLPTGGHWIPRIRVCWNDDQLVRLNIEPTQQCSPWAISTDPEEGSTVEPWWLFTWIAKPGPIEY